MSVQIKIDGGAEFRAALDKMSDDIRKEVSKAVMGTALELQTNIKKDLQEPGTGRIYEKYNPRRTHQASSPGQPPASDSSRLFNSITFDVENDLSALVGSALTYALVLEYGTRGDEDSKRILPRPFFEPNVEKIRPIFGERLVEALRKATR